MTEPRKKVYGHIGAVYTGEFRAPDYFQEVETGRCYEKMRYQHPTKGEVWKLMTGGRTKTKKKELRLRRLGRPETLNQLACKENISLFRAEVQGAPSIILYQNGTPPDREVCWVGLPGYKAITDALWGRELPPEQLPELEEVMRVETLINPERCFKRWGIWIVVRPYEGKPGTKRCAVVRMRRTLEVSVLTQYDDPECGRGLIEVIQTTCESCFGLAPKLGEDVIVDEALALVARAISGQHQPH